MRCLARQVSTVYIVSRDNTAVVYIGLPPATFVIAGASLMTEFGWECMG